MAQHNLWLLVADASRARLFVVHDVRRRQQQPVPSWLVQLRAFEHPQSRLLAQDLVSDRPGRVQQSPAPQGEGRGSRSGMEPHTPPREIEHEHFARELSDVLQKGLVEHQFEHLLLILAPAFLGTLRKVLDEQVARRVLAALDKDYTQLGLLDLAAPVSALLGDLSPSARSG